MKSQIIHGDSLEVLAEMDENSIDACVTDPPYELGFMGKAWDSTGIAYNANLWEKVLRVLKPGAHLLAFGGSRTYHRMACAIEDAGFEIRDQMQWIYGSGFPKSLDVSKAIDKAVGAERNIIGKSVHSANRTAGAIWGGTGAEPERLITEPCTESAKQWNGWGTALKPAHEPIVLARKPLSEKTVATNILKWGTGALNIDRCRISAIGRPLIEKKIGEADKNKTCYGDGLSPASKAVGVTDQGRFPANVILDEESGKMLDEQSGKIKSGDAPTRRSAAVFKNCYGTFQGSEECPPGRAQNSGGASRFFYCAKASRTERGKDNTHPTVKPIKLIQYLVKLVTPPGGVVLDPFGGSGTTGVACRGLGFDWIIIEKDKASVEIAEGRMGDSFI